MANVSVIMAAYNSEKFISDAINSVLSQTYKDFELIVVNDGSTDKTLSIIESYAQRDPRVKFINQKNKGAAFARNAGLGLSVGNFISILDSDDIILPRKLEIQVGLLNKNNDIGLVYGDVYHADTELNLGLKESEKYKRDFSSGDAFHKLAVSNFFSVHAALFRRSSLDFPFLHLVDEDMIGDWHLWLRLAEHSSFLYHSDVVGVYRFHEGMSVKVDNALKQLNMRLNVLNELELMARYPEIDFCTKSKIHFESGRLAQRFGLNKEALSFYLKSIRCFPFNAKSWAGLSVSCMHAFFQR